MILRCELCNLKITDSLYDNGSTKKKAKQMIIRYSCDSHGSESPRNSNIWQMKIENIKLWLQMLIYDLNKIFVFITFVFQVKIW